MKQRIAILFAGGLLALALSGVATAGPLEDGTSAYQRGDYATAMQLWRPTAEQGNAYAQNNVGLLYQYGQGVPQDFAQALEWYRKAADQGNALAQANLGNLYANGQGVPQDYVQAYRWFDLAASHASIAEIREIAVKARDEVATKMTPSQIAEAHRAPRRRPLKRPFKRPPQPPEPPQAPQPPT